MIDGYNSVFQALLGTLFTWGLTALGAAIVFLPTHLAKTATQKQFLDASLGFASGVMIAASYWSLLAPAIEICEKELGNFAWFPASIGFSVGALFVYGCDYFLPIFHVDAPSFFLESQKEKEDEMLEEQNTEILNSKSSTIRRKKTIQEKEDDNYFEKKKRKNDLHWRRIVLLVLAITIHNFPEGLAVGVGFGAIGHAGATFQKARNLAIGVGIQNFPEGMAVSLPLKRSGMSSLKAFWYGQISGMVEPIGGILGSALVFLVRPILPYSLAFAAGAMIFVVVDDLIPEARSNGNHKLASWSTIIGFNIMMILDVAFG